MSRRKHLLAAPALATLMSRRAAPKAHAAVPSTELA